MAEQELSEAQRQQIFLTLVYAQDSGMTVAESRRAVAKQAGVTEDEVRRIESEGLEKQWPPL